MKALSTHTLHELQILPRGMGEPSVLSLLNKAHTYTGKDLIQKLLCTPLDSVIQILERQKLIQYATAHLDRLEVSIPHVYITAAQKHLDSNLARISAKTWFERYRQTLWLRRFRTYDYYQLLSGTAALQLVLRTVGEKTAWWRNNDQLPAELQASAQTLRLFFDHAQPTLTTTITPTSMLKVDYFLRHQYVDQVKAVVEVFFQLDAYCGIAAFLQTAHWNYPSFVQTQQPTFNALDMKHPLISEDAAIGNDFSLGHP